MALPIRVIARALMPAWAKRGLSAAAVTREIKSRFGRAYRRTKLLTDYREAQGLITNELGLSKLKKITKIPKNLMTETVLRIPRRYMVIAKAIFTDPVTGVKTEKHISWYTNSSGSTEELVDEYIGKLAPTTYGIDELPSEIQLRAMKHNKALGY